MKNKLKSFFTKNIGVKVISLLLGIVLWAALSNRYDPVTTKTLNVPVTYLNGDKLLSEQKYVLMEAPETVQITANVRTSKKAKAVPDLFTCTADLCDHNGGDIGSQRVHINVTQVSGFDIVLDWSYAKNDPNIIVSLDDYIEKLFTIGIMPEDSLTEGLILENSISFSPNVVKVSGPKSKFGNLASVKAIVNYKELSEGGGGVFEKELPLHLYDANDNIINNTDGMLSLNTENAVMNATVTRIQTVSIIVGGTIGEPAGGFRYVSSSAEPSSIAVHGLKVNVADLTELTIPAEYINITDLSSDRDYTIDIQPLLPEGVFLAEGDGLINVHVTMEHLETSVYPVKTSAISISGKKEEFDYAINEDSVNVRVKGFKEDLQLLTAESLKLRMDLSHLMTPGTHKVPVYVEEIPGYTIENSGTIYVYVVVKENENYTTESEETESETTEESEKSGEEESTEKENPDPETPEEPTEPTETVVEEGTP